MIAAAVVGGLVLIGVPFLISGPDEKPGPVAADAPAGSPTGPGGSGPGIVPGEQRAPDSGSLEKSGKHGGSGVTGPAGKGAVDAPGGIHEGGGVEAKGGSGSAAPGSEDAARTAKDGSTATGTKSKTGTGTGTGETVADNAASGTTASGSGSGSGSGTTQKTVAQSTVVYTGVTGRGYATPSGGWTGDGCNGSYDSVPMSGDVNTDMQSRVKWWWSPGSKACTCQISVYIPNSTSTLYVGPPHITCS